MVCAFTELPFRSRTRSYGRLSLTNNSSVNAAWKGRSLIQILQGAMFMKQCAAIPALQLSALGGAQRSWARVELGWMWLIRARGRVRSLGKSIPRSICAVRSLCNYSCHQRYSGSLVVGERFAPSMSTAPAHGNSQPQKRWSDPKSDLLLSPVHHIMHK